MKRILGAKFPTKCAECAKEIASGEIIVWEADTGLCWCRQCALPPRESDSMSNTPNR